MKNVHLPFDRPFENLRVLSNVEGLMALSKVEGRRYRNFSISPGKFYGFRLSPE